MSEASASNGSPRCALFYEAGSQDWNLVTFYVYPASTPTSVESSIVAPLPSEDSPRYDLTGREITGPANGIYIQDGRKMLTPRK